MSKQQTNKDFQTDWAFDESFKKHIHISNAESGKNGYYCLGCKKELIAVKGQIREHYFRHHAKDVDKNYTECVVANRNYRERIARDILQRLKQLKLPALYKYPPKKSDEKPNLLQPSKILTASMIKSELTFYEDDNCNIHYGQNPDIDERYLLVRPDITFFNEKEKPILLVEFVITHKIDNEKKSKLKRLGINTVQIIIPKKSEGDIERALKSSSKVKWVYNEIESTTDYLQTSESLNNGVWEIDDEQRRIFEESYNCRSIQIKNLIRSVSRSMESQSYKRAKHQFNRAISRVEKATEREGEELAALESRYDAEVYSQIAGEFEQLEIERNELEKAEKEFQRYFEDLESRYLGKKRELEESTEENNRIRTELSRNPEAKEQVNRRFESDRVWTETKFESRENKIRGLIKIAEEEIQKIKEKRAEIIDDFDSLTTEERSSFEREERLIKLEEGAYKKIVRANFREDLENNARGLSKEIKTLLEARRLGDDFKNLQRQEDRYQRARELFNSGAWKSR